MPKTPRKTAVERELEAQIEDLNRVRAELQANIKRLQDRCDDNTRFADALRRRLETLRNARAPK